MNVLLVSPKMDTFPLGISYISASLKKAGHTVKGHIFSSPSRLGEELMRGGFDLAGIGGMTLHFNSLKVISEIIREHGVPIVGGGSAFTSEPELFSRELKVDFAVLGEGEEAIVALVDALERKRPVERIPGIGYFSGKDFRLTGPPKQITALDSLPYPDFEEFGYLDFLKTLKPTDQLFDVFDQPKAYPLLTSRSCPYLCTFCYHPLGTKYRERSVKSIIEEIDFAISKYGINIVEFYDELFAQNEARFKEFCRKFKETTAKYPWPIRFSCSLRVSDIKEGVLDMLKDAGCHLIIYGFESYSPIVLKSMKKYISPEQIHQALHKTLEKKIAIQASFIFGDPAETLETAHETLSFWKKHPEAGILLQKIIPCPDSEDYRLCLRKGLIKDKIRFFSKDLYEPVNMTSMTEGDFQTLLADISKYYHRYLTYVVPLSRKNDSHTIKCPYCGEIVLYKNYSTHPLFYCRATYCRSCRKRFLNSSGLYVVFARILSIMTTPFTYRIFRFLKKISGIISPHLIYKDLKL